MLKKKLKWAILPLAFVLSVTIFSSYVNEDESPVTAHGTSWINLGHIGSPPGHHYTGAEIKSTTIFIGSMTSNAGGQLSYNGKVLSGSFNVGANKTVQATITDKECKDCFWGETWCSVGCRREEDARYISW